MKEAKEHSDQYGRILKLLRKQRPLQEIVKKVGCSRQFVYWVAKQENIDTSRRPSKEPVVVELLEQNPELHYTQVAEILGVSKAFISQVAKQHGITQQREAEREKRQKALQRQMEAMGAKFKMGEKTFAK